MCYFTKIHPAYFDNVAALGLEEKDVEVYHVTGKKQMAVKRDKEKGILPKILDELLNARAAARRAIKVAVKEGRDNDAKILDGRQLALKISANRYVSAHVFLTFTRGILV